MVGLLCRTPGKESRHELLRRVAAGGGVFQSDNGSTKVHLPAANLNDIANQADDLLEVDKSLFKVAQLFVTMGFFSIFFCHFFVKLIKYINERKGGKVL